MLFLFAIERKMTGVSNKLIDEEVFGILLACGKNKRHSKRKLNTLMPQYENKIRKMAKEQLAQWQQNGLSKREWDQLKEECPRVIMKFKLSLNDDQTTTHSNISQQNEKKEEIVSPVNNYNTEDIFLEDEKLSEENAAEAEGKLSFLTILRHFAAYTNQKHTY